MWFLKDLRPFAILIENLLAKVYSLWYKFFFNSTWRYYRVKGM